MDLVCANGHSFPQDAPLCPVCGQAPSGYAPAHPGAAERTAPAVPAWPVLPDAGVAPDSGWPATHAATEPSGWGQAPAPGPVPWPSPGPGVAYYQPPGGGRKKNAWIAVVVIVAIVALGGLSFALVSQHEGSGSHRTAIDANTSSTAVTTTAATVSTTAPVSTTSKPRKATTTTTTVATTTTLPVTERPGYAAAEEINQLLSESTSDRQGVVAAVADVGACGDLSQDETTLGDAAQSRQNLIDSVQALDVGLLPDGRTIQSDLINAWNDSLASDEAYANWASDEGGNCTPNDTSDPAFQQAAQADSASTQAKEDFAAVWNPVAAGFDLPAVSASQI